MSTPATTSDAILASARGFIVSGGYNAFSYADISAVVGIRKASIHHHFPTKADLVRVLMTRYREAAEQGLAGLSANVPDSLQALQLFAGNWEKCISDASIPFCVCALLASELPVLPPEVALEVRAYFRSLSSWLAGVIETGAKNGLLIIESEAAVEAEVFMATVHGAMLSARAQSDPALFGVIVRPMLRRLSGT